MISLRVNPGLRFLQLAVVEVLDLGGRKWLAEDRHTRFPFRFADDRQPLDVFPMFEIELEVFPQRAGSSAVEIVHLE